MEKTFDVMEPLPRLCPVDIPVLFGGTTISNTCSAAAEGQGAPDNNDRDRGGDEQDAVSTELDACMRVLEDINPKVGTGRRDFV